MKDHTEQENAGPVSNGGSKDDETVAKLMNLAGARSEISTDIETRVHERVIREWRDATVRKPAARWVLPIGLAASVLVALALLINAYLPAPPPLGAVTRLAGTAADQRAGPAIGDIVRVGDTIRAGRNQGIGISLENGASLRLANSTVLHFDSAITYSLEFGEVYADSGHPDQTTGSMTVRTELGSVTDKGTQFAVQFADEKISVAVREGAVNVAGDARSYSALAGDRLTIRAGGGVTLDEITANDPSWDWATELAPDFEMTGKSLFDFLSWAARETGRELIFSSDEWREMATATVLRGSLAGFTPQQAIEAVLATTSFEYDINDDRLIVGK